MAAGPPATATRPSSRPPGDSTSTASADLLASHTRSSRTAIASTWRAPRRRATTAHARDKDGDDAGADPAARRTPRATTLEIAEAERRRRDAVEVAFEVTAEPSHRPASLQPGARPAPGTRAPAPSTPGSRARAPPL